MNKIVHDHLPATALPKALREGIDDAATVRVIVEQEENRPPIGLGELRLLLLAAKRARLGITTDQAVGRIRSLRDEWED